MSDSPMAVAETEWPETKAIGKPARCTSLAERVSKTPGKAIGPTSSRMRWMRVLPVMAPERGERTVAGYGRGNSRMFPTRRPTPSPGSPDPHWDRRSAPRKRMVVTPLATPCLPTHCEAQTCQASPRRADTLAAELLWVERENRWASRPKSNYIAVLISRKSQRKSVVRKPRVSPKPGLPTLSCSVPRRPPSRKGALRSYGPLIEFPSRES
jgi:hypothetical protein